MSRLPDARRCQEWAEQMLSYALAAGADAAEVLVRDGSELEVKVRLGEPELVKDAGSRALGLRVLRDHRVAVTYTSDFAPAAMRQFARESVELCELAEPDPLADLPEPHEMAREVPDLDLWDETAPSLDAAQALRLARQGEQAALHLDRRVTNSEGGICSRVMGATAVCQLSRFLGRLSRHQPVAGGRAGVRRRRRQEAQRPLLDGFAFHLGVAGSRGGRIGGGAAHLGQVGIAQDCHLSGAGRVRARSGARSPGAAGGCDFGRSRVAQEQLPGRARGHGRRFAFGDGGGRPASAARARVAALRRRRPGRAAQRGGIRGRAAHLPVRRVLGTQAGPQFNRIGGTGPGRRAACERVELRPARGQDSSVELERLPQGLYVTDLMGFGFNPVTGDWSQGANGFWIDNGSRAHPVSEITISINFDDLWKSIDGVGNDLDTRGSVQSPTLRVSRITVAGT